MIDKVRRIFRENPRLYPLAGVIAIFLLFMIIGINSSRIAPRNEGDQPNSASGAFMVYQDKPYLPFNDTLQNNSLRHDLKYYAKAIYAKEYDPEKQASIVFSVSGEPKTEGNTLQFSGTFSEAKGDITVKVEQLKNRRVKTSITNTKSDKNIDSELPSNSKINQFIGSLPIETENYSIEYSDDPVVISIRLSELSSENEQGALDVISSAMGADFVNDTNIDIFYLETTANGERGVYRETYINQPDSGDDIGELEFDETEE